MSVKFSDGSTQSTAGIQAGGHSIFNTTNYEIGFITASGFTAGITLKSNHILNLLPGTEGSVTYPQSPVTRSMAVKNLEFYTVTSSTDNSSNMTKTLTFFMPAGKSTHNLVGFIPSWSIYNSNGALNGNSDARISWTKNHPANTVTVTVFTINRSIQSSIKCLMIFQNTYSD